MFFPQQSNRLSTLANLGVHPVLDLTNLTPMGSKIILLPYIPITSKNKWKVIKWIYVIYSIISYIQFFFKCDGFNSPRDSAPSEYLEVQWIAHLLALWVNFISQLISQGFPPPLALVDGMSEGYLVECIRRSWSENVFSTTR